MASIKLDLIEVRQQTKVRHARGGEHGCVSGAAGRAIDPSGAYPTAVLLSLDDPTMSSYNQSTDLSPVRRRKSAR
jgi:hypothetical protein